MTMSIKIRYGAAGYKGIKLCGELHVLTTVTYSPYLAVRTTLSCGAVGYIACAQLHDVLHLQLCSIYCLMAEQ